MEILTIILIVLLIYAVFKVAYVALKILAILLIIFLIVEFGSKLLGGIGYVERLNCRRMSVSRYPVSNRRYNEKNR